MPFSTSNLVFVGFNSRVAALDAGTGEIAWAWEAPKNRGGYVTLLLLDNGSLVAAVDGYIYCLDSTTGTLIWHNETKGFGTGVTSMVAANARTLQDSVVAGAAQTIAASHAAAAAT